MKAFFQSLMRRKVGAIAMAILIFGLVGGVTAGAVLGSGAGSPAAAPAAPLEGSDPDIFIYSAKVVCVPSLGNPLPVLVSGKYKTAVNVHNPSGNPVTLEKWITLAPRQGLASITGDHIAEVLGPWEAFDVDCQHMANDFGLDGAKVPGGDGFFVIVSDGPLTVVAVYTAQKKVTGGVGASIDTEYVQPRVISAPGSLANGNFESGVLSPWSLTSDSSTLQQEVVEYPNDPITTNLPYVGGTYAFKIRPGSQAPNAAIEQTVTVVPGTSCTLDLDVAARELQATSFNLGTVTAFLDGVAVDSHAFGVPGNSNPLYAHLSGSQASSGFFMTVSIGFTRPHSSGAANPLHLLDNVTLVC